MPDDPPAPVLAYGNGRSTDGPRRLPLSVAVASLLVAIASLCFSGLFVWQTSARVVRDGRQWARLSTPARGLTAAEAAAAVARLGAIGRPSPLNAAQVTTLTALLTAPTQHLLAPPAGSGGVPLAAQSITAFAQPDGSVTVYTNHAPDSGMVTLDPGGQLRSASVWAATPTGYAVTMTTAGGTTTTTAGTTFRTTVGTRLAADAAVAAASTVNLLLAVLLGVAAVRGLSRRTDAVALHRRFALLKFPAAAVAAAAAVWMTYAGSMAAPAPLRTPPILVMGGIGVLACAYPAFLLAYLRRPRL